MVAVIESALRQGEVEAQIVELESSFYALLDGIKAQLPNLDDSAYQQQVHSSMTQLRQFVHGITLLGMCPDNVNARIISKGERVSIQLMKAVMEAKGLPANLVDPVKYLLAKGDHLEAMVDVEISTQRFRQAPLPQQHVNIMPGFTVVV
ncbi:aspartate kinase, partial [Vibrio cholerae]